MATLLRPLVDKVFAEAGDRYESIVNVKRELISLKRIVSLIEGALPEAEEKQVNNPVIRDWLRELHDICYEARDILEEFDTSIRAKRASKQVKSNSLHYFLLGSRRFSTVIPFRFRLAKKIKNLRKRLDSMKKDMETAQLLDFVGGAGCFPNASKKNRPETGPSPDIHLFVGRDVEKEKIMEKLLNPKENHVEIVPIWGMGGVGKTTLAQSVYNDEGVTEEEYPTKNRRWLCVGEKKFDAKEIISKITDEFATTNDVEVYHRKLIEKFREDRFLIVLDDIWDIDISEWKLFYNPLNRIRKGGLIIITTRTKEVITAINTLVPDDLRRLSYDDCWHIFESHAFVDGHPCSDLEKKKCIGKKIVKKLKGLPLAAEVVGRSLSSEPDVQIWRSFLETDEWKLRTGDDDVMTALKWSYNRLPPHLKQCFTYCSLFPKDHVFNEKILVKMWMAHGFIQNVEGGGEKRRPEDIGALYFKQLVYASFFQCVDDKYVMHDMIHDLAILVSNEEFFSTDDLLLDVTQLEKVRHISIPHGYFWNNLSLCKSKRSTLKRLLTLCTISKFSISHRTTSLYKNVIQDIFKQLTSIRVLVLHSFKINYIPECISELIHLRYLDIKNTAVDRIPDTLCDLHNLQTLVARIKYYPFDTVMPKNIVNMDNLRHLRARLLTCKGVKNLTSLQELYSISVSKGDMISELGEMRQLRGYLEINCLENVTSEEDATQARMQEKTYIDDLKLKFTEGLGDTDVQTKVLDALQCPPNLRRLEIYAYNGLTSPSWMVDGKLIMNLQSLHLLNCHQLELLPPLGQLNCLKDLYFNAVGAINKLGEEFYGKQINNKVFFPSLEELDLRFMENLKEWDDIVIEDTGVMFFPCLKFLSFFRCPSLVSALPHVKIATPHMDIKDPLRNAANVMRSLSKLEICYCGELVVLELDILVSLKHLEITECSNLTRITSTINVDSTVETLSIKRCEKLEKMEFGSLSSLKNLIMDHCNELVISFPSLVAVEELTVRLCKNLRSVSFSDRGLNSLQSISVFKCPMLEILFEDAPTSSSPSSTLRLSRLQFLTTDNISVFSKMSEHDLVSLEEMCIGLTFPEVTKNSWHKLMLLKTMVIFQCDDLVSLPPDIHMLSSLKTLCLHGCPQLQALPIDGLPLSLEHLLIAECPLLYQRCQMESGSDWHKIRHISKRKIQQTITYGTRYDFELKGRFPLRNPYDLFEINKHQSISPMLESVFEDTPTSSSSSSTSSPLSRVDS